MTRHILAAAAALGLAPLAHADGVAEIAAPSSGSSEQVRIAWHDADTLRVDTNEPGSYILARDGSLYAVTDQAGPDLVVLDMSSMGAMAQSMGGDMPSIDGHRAASVETVRATGRRETVAGIDGEIYEIEWTDASGAGRKDEAVLSDNRLAREFTAAFSAFATAVDSASDARSLAIEQRELGILRYGDDFRLVSLSGDGPGAGHFALPAEPMTMQDMMRGRGPN